MPSGWDGNCFHIDSWVLGKQTVPLLILHVSSYSVFHFSLSIWSLMTPSLKGKHTKNTHNIIYAISNRWRWFLTFNPILNHIVASLEPQFPWWCGIRCCNPWRGWCIVGISTLLPHHTHLWTHTLPYRYFDKCPAALSILVNAKAKLQAH